jgi:hypothetical protein
MNPAAQADVGEQKVFRVDDAGPLATPTTSIGNSSRRWSTLAPSVRVFSHAVGLKISPRPGPSIRSMKESPVPVMTSALLSRSRAISSSAAGKSACVLPVNAVALLIGAIELLQVAAARLVFGGGFWGFVKTLDFSLWATKSSPCSSSRGKAPRLSRGTAQLEQRWSDLLD